MTRSLWLDTTADLALPPLTEDTEADVCVIGAGIFGMTVALLLAEAGRTVAVVEADRVGSGVSGTTTAKVSVLQGTTLRTVAARFGEEGARAYAEANTAGLELLVRWVRERRIACDLRRRPAVTYAREEPGLPDLEAEVKAGQPAGVDLRLVEAVDLPFRVAGAVVLDDQAELHPRRYLLGLAGELQARGGRIFERTRATRVHEGAPCRVDTPAGTVTCADVVVATHYPILDRGLYFARLTPQRSYAIAVRVDGRLPHGMFISSDAPTRSLRAHPMDDGDEILVVGGEGHTTGRHDAPTEERYAALERWAREHFAVRSVDYRWSAQDPSSADGLPYVGRYGPTSRHLWVATGFNKWGFTNAGAAALMVADRILGRESGWLDTFDANRARPLAAGPTLLRENLEIGARFVRDRLRRPDYDSVADVAPGRGGVVVVDGRRVGVFRREDGRVDAVSVTCTHLGCHLRFNDAERTWDCPCHGSRFDTTGRVLEGPAVKDLERRRAPQSTGA